MEAWRTKLLPPPGSKGQIGRDGVGRQDRYDLFQGRHEIVEEAKRVVVAFIERHSGGRNRHGAQPTAHQRRLAIARRGADEDQALVEPVLELCIQAGALNPAGADGRYHQLGAEKWFKDLSGRLAGALHLRRGYRSRGHGSSSLPALSVVRCQATCGLCRMLVLPEALE